MIGKRKPKTHPTEAVLDLTPPEMSYAAREALRSYTPARVALQRTGVSLATRPLLDFQLAHARARDAVHGAIDVRMLCDELRRSGLAALALESEARDRATYLRRPDLGRALSKDSAVLLTPGDYDVVFVIADGLSALAVERHAAAFVTRGAALDRGLAAGAGMCCGAGPGRGWGRDWGSAPRVLGGGADWGAAGIKLARFSGRLHYLGAAAGQERRGTELHLEHSGRGLGLRCGGGQVALLHARSGPSGR